MDINTATSEGGRTVISVRGGLSAEPFCVGPSGRAGTPPRSDPRAPQRYFSCIDAGPRRTSDLSAAARHAECRLGAVSNACPAGESKCATHGRRDPRPKGTRPPVSEPLNAEGRRQVAS